MIPAVFNPKGWFCLKNIGFDVGSFSAGDEVIFPLLQCSLLDPFNQQYPTAVRAYAPPSVVIAGAASPNLVLQTPIFAGTGDTNTYDVLTAMTQPFDFVSGYQYAVKFYDGSSGGPYQIRYLNYAQCMGMTLEQYGNGGGMILTIALCGTDTRPEGDSDDEFTSGINFSTTDASPVLGEYIDRAMIDFGSGSFPSSDPYADGVYGYKVTFKRRCALQFGSPDPNFPTRPSYIASGVCIGAVDNNGSAFDLYLTPEADFIPDTATIIRAFDSFNQYIYLDPTLATYPIQPAFGQLGLRYRLIDVTEDFSVYPLTFGEYV